MSTLASVIIYDLFANRPAFGIAGRLFFASDTLQMFYDTGAAWQQVEIVPVDTAAVTHQFFTAYTAATGAFTAAQPAVADITWAGGVTGSRPASPILYQPYFDTTLAKPIWWDGTNWVDATGAIV